VVVGTKAALRFIKEILNAEAKTMVAKDGDSIDLGGKTLKFIQAPFLHWPDTMFTYLPEDSALFTCDAFGCHYCDADVFNDLIKGEFQEAYKYYFDAIMGPFKEHVASALKKIEGLKIDMILNGHGPVIRKDPMKYINYYREWSKPQKNGKPLITIAYVSAYGYTKKLSEAISSGIESESKGSFEVKSFNLVYDDKAAALAAVEASDGFLLGSPTMVGEALPPVYELLAWLNPISHKGKLAGAFGSFGWSGEAVPNIEARLKQLKFKMPVPGLKVQFNPSDAQLKEAFELGVKFAQAIAQTH
jgi:flavorubredoxin